MGHDGIPGAKEGLRARRGAGAPPYLGRDLRRLGYEPEEVIDAGDSVFVGLRQWGRGKGSGVPVEYRFFGVWTFRDGKVIRYKGFNERAEALEAVGLSE
jgi:ketosteroid isomerase-like protein